MFNVGDIVKASRGTIFTVTVVSTSGLRVSISHEELPFGTYSARLFTLVTPATPKLTGMTQFFKDKEKSNV